MSSGQDVKQGRLNPAALPVEAAARLLTAAGGVRVDADQLQDDIDRVRRRKVMVDETNPDSVAFASPDE